MTTEETPLLADDHNRVYDRFSRGKKHLLVAIVSWGGLVAFFTSGTFLPSIPQIAKDLNSTGEVVNIAVSIYMLAASLGGLVGSKYSKFYGRRPSYLWHLPVMIVGSLGVARAKSVSQLLTWRVVQGIGASPSLSVGAGVIGDIYKLEERGAALGSYFGTCLFGWALAPVIGGATAHYWTWRAIHYFLAIFGLGAFVCILLVFPETSHPGSRGIDEYRRNERPLPSWRPVILNPFSQLLFLRSPTVLAVSLIGSLAVLTDFALLLPLPYTIGKKYGIENEALLGLCILPLGIGNAIGSPVSGWVSDRMVIKYRQKRGYWYPEDRLRASLYSCFLPLTVLTSGLITTYISSPIGLALNFVCLFINGIGCDVALTPCGAYVVDVLHANSAEVTAARLSYSMWLSVSTAMLLPLINKYGLLFTNSLVALLSLAGVGITVLTITYGESMRAWVDIGYSTAETN
ncbi:hypothetical protein NP233_g12168 [Leucocoprinus birnbaumii]|uniref:Major facilitator superfamily (MFS) profile domain-containing protein n=1 Tax=Leucocoprinus birnbaumii TaxID=56174 RepID=A0AAD5VHK2_9AGAR|nr:hypothetical protein NP233_g12168 [Leucocoprinus birnbaumii]